MWVVYFSYVKEFGDWVCLGGVLFGDDGEIMIGSLIVVEVESLEFVEIWF